MKHDSSKPCDVAAPATRCYNAITMHTPVDQAPPVFMARYNAIIKGEESLDTIARLKDFWLFAVECGLKYPKKIETISHYTGYITWYKTPYYKGIYGTNKNVLLDEIGYTFNAYEYIGPSDNPELTDIDYALGLWRDLETKVRAVDVDSA